MVHGFMGGGRGSKVVFVPSFFVPWGQLGWAIREGALQDTPIL